MTKIISVLSGKGGVGKTTMITNLATALANKGKKVVVVDANLSAPNLAIHLGIPTASLITLNDVLRNDAYITHAMYLHKAGFYVVPASIDEIETELGGFKNNIGKLLGNADIVLIDSAPGINKEVDASIDVSDEVLLVMTPDEPSLRNAMITKKRVEERGKEVMGVIINQTKGSKYELSNEYIEDMLDEKILGRIGYHRKFKESVAHGTPFINYAPDSVPADTINRISYYLMDEEPPKPGFMDHIKNFMNRDVVIWFE